MAHPDADPDADPAAGVARPRLLHADEDRLRLVAATLARGKRFVLVVADAALWPVALELLRERLPDHTFVERAPTSSEETSQAISDPLRDAPGATIVIRVTGRDAGPIETLNLRRESLVKAAANFLVVLEGDEAHNRFLREAPDCYSYRHLLAVLQGEPSLVTPARPEFDEELFSASLERARKIANPKKRAELLSSLASLLLRLDEMPRAHELLEESIAVMTALSAQRALDDEERAFLAQLYILSALGDEQSGKYIRLRKARDLIEPIAERAPALFIEIKGQMFDAIGIDLEAARDAVRRARKIDGGLLGRQLANLALAYTLRQDFIRMSDLVAEIDATASVLPPYYSMWIMRFVLLFEAGAWDEADKLISSENEALVEPMTRRLLESMRVRLLIRRGERRAAQRLVETWAPSITRERTLISIATEGGQVRDARRRIEQLISLPRPESVREADDLLALHDQLIHVTELEVDAQESALARKALDERLAALRLHIERTEPPDPPWALIQCLLLQTDAYLERSGAERLAIPHAEEAWKLADERASVLVSRIARRLVVASLRLGELDRAQDWLARGLARAGEHEHRGDEARLRGLALWREALAGGDVARAEAEMRAAIAATGSVLVEASVLARVGAALGRRDLLQRAQQIYRSLPWPEREGPCLEVLGETRIAEVRYRTFGLAARLAILERRAGPPPITDTDDI